MATFYPYNWVAFLVEIYITYSFIHSSVDGHSGCFHFLATVNDAAMTIGVHASFQVSVFVFLRYMPWSGTAGSHGSSVFSFLRHLHTVFHSSCTTLQAQQKCTRVPYSPHPCQDLLSVGFFFFFFWMMIAILRGVSYISLWFWFAFSWCLVLEHLFISLLAICISSLEKCLFSSSAHF